jgi:hypothetical protein
MMICEASQAAFAKQKRTINVNTIGPRFAEDGTCNPQL